MPGFSPDNLRESLFDSVGRLVHADRNLLSASLVGSFADTGRLEDAGDIDLVVVLRDLNETLFHRTIAEFDVALRPLFSQLNLDLCINPTLGPLKLYGPGAAVLHLMMYTPESHANHVVQSPFTCLSWQQSMLVHGEPLAAIYPVFGLQPHHFFSGRRGAADYLRDLHANTISYRQPLFDNGVYREERRSRPMDERDRHEFAYHIMKFLMQNFLKLVDRSPTPLPPESLLARFFERMPEEAGDHTALFRELSARKRERRFEPRVPDLIDRTTRFVESFERQFRCLFRDEACCHLFFRHAMTARNGAGIFLSREDVPILPPEPAAVAALRAAAAAARPIQAYHSPLRRCAESCALAGLGADVGAVIDDRLIEQDYGSFDGLLVSETRDHFPAIWEAWSRGEDPAFPGGESTADLWKRVHAFLNDRVVTAAGPLLVATHNGVLRCLVGSLLGVPRRDWHRLVIPHLSPLRVIRTRDGELFLDLDEATEREIFSSFRTH